MDAEDFGTITESGQVVSEWRNKAGPGRVNGAGASFRPTLDLTAINNRPGIVFDGTDDYLTGGANFTTLQEQPLPREIWALVRQDAPGSDTAVRNLHRFGTTTNQRMQLARSSVGGVSRFRSSIGTGSAEPPATESTVDFTGKHIVRSIITPTTISAFVDNSAPTTLNSVGVLGTGSFYIGSQNTTSTFWQGAISQFLITAPLSTANATLLMNYLKTKGGIV